MIVIESLEDLLAAFDSAKQGDISGGMFSYYVKVVPTNYHYLTGEQIKTNQYSATEHYKTLSNRPGEGLPGRNLIQTYIENHLLLFFVCSII